MTRQKERLTVTVDRALVEAGTHAVAAGKAQSLSGWINLAMAERAAKERKLQALADAVAIYEAEFGTLTEAELVAQERADKRSAVVVRGPKKTKAPSTRRISK